MVGKMKVFRPLSVAILSAVTVMAMAGSRITTYDGLLTALKSGKHVRVVIEYSKTKLQVGGKDTPTPDAWGGLSIETWDRFAKGQVGNDKEFIGVTQSSLTQHPAYGFVTNFVRLRFDPDGGVNIHSRFARPGPPDPLSDQTFVGKLSTGKDKNAVSLFVTD